VGGQGGHGLAWGQAVSQDWRGVDVTTPITKRGTNPSQTRRKAQYNVQWAKPGRLKLSTDVRVMTSVCEWLQLSLAIATAHHVTNLEHSCCLLRTELGSSSGLILSYLLFSLLPFLSGSLTKLWRLLCRSKLDSLHSPTLVMDIGCNSDCG
jgi:hypothetical protein